MAAAPQPKPMTAVAPRRIPIAGGYINVYPNGKRVKVLHGVAQGWGSVPNIAARPFGAAPRAAASQPRPGASAQDVAGLKALQAGGVTQPSALAGGFAPDAQYLTDAASRMFQKETALQQNESQQVTNVQNRQNTLAALAKQQPVDLQQANVNRNRQGLFYSSTLGNDRSNIQAGYLTKQNQAEQTYANEERNRMLARQAITAGYGVDEAAAMVAAADRQIARDSTAADANSLVPNPAPAPKPKAAPAPRVIHTQRQPTTRGRRPRRKKK